MGALKATIDLVVVLVGVFLVYRTSVVPARAGSGGRPAFAPNLPALIGALILVIAGLTVSSSFGEVPSGARGVVLRFGAVTGQIKPEGLYMVNPGIESVVLMNTQINKIQLDDATAVTSDRQEVHTTVALLVQLDPSRVDATYRDYRQDISDRVIVPTLNEAVKSVTARYDAKFQVQNRSLVQQAIETQIRHDLDGKGVLIPPNGVKIVNFSYNSAYQDAIEQTAVSQQNLVKAEADLKVAQITAQTTITKAEGDSKANALLAQRATPELVQLRTIEKWDGHAPLVVGAGGTLVGIDELTRAAAARK
jgi:regulator of protease activity HflC (stomatin/prohibitin superfamily)